ncbi:coiled-coil domain-containing protein 170-like [Talpa occidentalis]|uniref:coiled-coil domain-containing protein 170-like n=1 Tax=Talpa occidentalis TaxID=50954 RepID=UPI0023F7D305|nr:coiled-coil domain-containing protein 170-like [Talpa occidentalis]XP_054547002.1 coiled-coil domain-containing protein 170-like [Talpa occidentalis]
MSGPLQFLDHSVPGRPAIGESKGSQEVKLSEVKHLSAHTSPKNNPVACFDPSLEVLPVRNPIMSHKRAADTIHPDLAGLLVKNKNLLAKLRNLQNKLVMKESFLQEMKSELESYKENNVQQSFQIMSLKDDIKDLENLIASLTRIKSLKNINIQNLERGNWDLTERIIELENRLRVHLLEREKAEQKANLLEKKLAGGSRFIPLININGQEDFLDSFMIKENSEAILPKNIEQDNIFHSEGPKDLQKIWDKCQRDLFHKEKQKYELDRPPCSFSWETKTVESHYQKFLGELATLLSNSMDPIPATEEAVKGRIQEISANEQSWKFRTEGLQQEIQMLTERLDQLHQHYEACVQELSQTEKKCREQKRPLKHLEGKIATTDFFQGRLDLDRDKENTETKNSQIEEHRMFKQLEKDNKQQTLWNTQQNLQMDTTQKLEEKIQKLQKQLSDLKLANKNMKTQLTKVNILKDKTMKKLRRSLIKIEAMKGKAVMKTDNLKITLDSAEQEARRDKERAHQTLDIVIPELCTSKSPREEVSGQELVDFRETIMKILGFNKKAANKEIVNHLRLIIQAYQTSKKSKIASDCETGKDNE